MSSLWTPDGERPVGRETPPAPSPSPAEDRELTPEEQAQYMAALQQQLAETPVEIMVANHAYGLFELAALHLSAQPPNLDQAQLAIDGLAGLLGAVTGRLGEPEKQLTDALSQLQMAYVQVKQATGG